MEHEDILKQIREEIPIVEKKPDQILLNKFLVFRIQDKPYALEASRVKEIINDSPLFYVPFVPPYVRGFINRHGQPYSVFDLNVILEKSKLDASTYLILNLENEQIAFLISDVVEVLRVPDSGIHRLSEDAQAWQVFDGSVTRGDKEALIINTSSLLKRLELDLE